MGWHKVAERFFVGMGGLILVLGLMIWTGRFGKQVGGLHVVLGLLLILTLWVLSALATRAGVDRRAVTWAASWGLVALVLGLAQEGLLTGPWHWTIRVLHVVISMGAIWWARRLLGQIRQRTIDESGSGPAIPPAIVGAGHRA
jgi:hypothetical protein